MACTGRGREGRWNCVRRVALALFCFLQWKAELNVVKCEGKNPGPWELRCHYFLWWQYFTRKKKPTSLSLQLCSSPTWSHFPGKVPSLWSIMAISSYNEALEKEKKSPCPVMCQALSGLSCRLPSHCVFSPSCVPWGLCGLRLLTTVIIKATKCQCNT